MVYLGGNKKPWAYLLVLCLGHILYLLFDSFSFVSKTLIFRVILSYKDNWDLWWYGFLVFRYWPMYVDELEIDLVDLKSGIKEAWWDIWI